MLPGCGGRADASGAQNDGSRQYIQAAADGLKLTVGGDEGRVIEVTNLNDSGPGSLRRAIQQRGPRKIIFAVGGEIWLKTALVIREPFSTIAGETAPSPGISLMGDSLRVRGHDHIIRHIRVRVGELSGHSAARNRDAISIDGSVDGRKPAYNILLDNVSVAWAVDENIQIYGENSYDIAVRNSIIAEGLFKSIHPKGRHSMGLLIGPKTQDILIQNNILASNRWRNPLVAAGASAVIANNLVYNPGAMALHFNGVRNAEPTRVSAIGNLVIAGPSTKPVLRSLRHGPRAGSEVYFEDNKSVGTVSFDQSEQPETGAYEIFVDQPPIVREGLKLHKSGAVLDYVKKNAGARPWDRDKTDLRILKEIETGGGSVRDKPLDKRLQNKRMMQKRMQEAKKRRK